MLKYSFKLNQRIYKDASQIFYVINPKEKFGHYYKGVRIVQTYELFVSNRIELFDSNFK